MPNHVIARELDDELMLYDAQRDSVHVLNRTARRIHELYKEGMSLDGMEQRLRKEFAVPPDQEIRTGIHACIDELLDKGLVEVR